MSDKIGVVRCLGNIANIYQGQNQLSQALEINQRCLKILEELGDKVYMNSLLGNIGNIYLAQNQDSLAQKYYLKSP
jgi:Tetratricopeptide repeat